MKNILSFLLIIGCLFSLSSCDGSKKEKTNEVDNNANAATKVTVKPSNNTLDSDSLLMLVKNMTKIKPYEVLQMKGDAEIIINHRYKETNKKSTILLDKDLWEFEFIFSGKKMTAPNQLEGCWIDFSEDLTYTYGYFQEEQGSGRYAYSIDTGLLLLIDDSDQVKPQEFEAKLFDITLVMDGNDIYKDNNYNAKLKRITQRPTK